MAGVARPVVVVGNQGQCSKTTSTCHRTRTLDIGLTVQPLELKHRYDNFHQASHSGVGYEVSVEVEVKVVIKVVEERKKTSTGRISEQSEISRYATPCNNSNAHWMDGLAVLELTTNQSGDVTACKGQLNRCTANYHLSRDRPRSNVREEKGEREKERQKEDKDETSHVNIHFLKGKKVEKERKQKMHRADRECENVEEGAAADGHEALLHWPNPTDAKTFGSRYISWWRRKFVDREPVDQVGTKRP
uniref:Uncharacterized protein n=1 Tax=Vespula pensylvanica TaxID=30213 RepID=A0A834KLA8_VESPE|nr:hypothetical protein H0235_014530 [Vespula pensylvanica]